MISLIITSQGRTKHLQRLLEGVQKNTMIPQEIIIISNDVGRKLLPENLNIKIISSPYEDFPIGKNRNLGAENASFDDLFFLDVDCIPAANYFEQLLNDFEEFGGLCMGEPNYLSQKVPENFSYDIIESDAIQHPFRPQLKETRKENDYALFWSLSFAISKEDFNRINGFDPEYIGYGAEDTDFGFKANEAQIPFYLSTAKVYHQQHPIYRPPVNHLKDIVFNSNVFYKKWNKWPMGGWLETFKEKGWINWSEDSTKEISIINLPSDKEIESYKKEKARFV